MMLFRSVVFLLLFSLVGNFTAHAQSTFDRDFDAFHAIKSYVPVDVQVRKSNRYHAHIASPKSTDLDVLYLSVSDGVLSIENKGKLKSTRRIKLIIETPSFDELYNYGSGDLVFSGFTTFDELTLKIIGEGNIVNNDQQAISASYVFIDLKGSGDLTLNAPMQLTNYLKAALNGSGDLSVSGRVPKVELVLAGSGHVKAVALEAAQATVHTTGSGNVQLHVSELLTVSSKGSGKVKYKGTADLDVESTGSGAVSKW